MNLVAITCVLHPVAEQVTLIDWQRSMGIHLFDLMGVRESNQQNRCVDVLYVGCVVTLIN